MTNDYKQLFQKQRSHFLTKVQHHTIADRRRKLKSIKDWIKKNHKEIIESISADFKKSPEEIKFGEIKPVLSEINDALIHVRKWSERKKVSTPLFLLGSRAEVLVEPKGVVLVVAPWNFPFMLTMGPVVSAIAAGNVVTIKPSELTPNTEQLILRMITELFEEKDVAVVTGDAKTGAALIEQPWNHIFFTGSPNVGKMVMAAAAKNLTSVTLELGGRNPAIVDETANLKDAAEKLIWGKCFNAGQSCIAPNYLLVHSSKYEEILVRLESAYNKMYCSGKQEMEMNKAFPRIVNKRNFDRVKGLVDAAVAEGAQVILGGDFNGSDNYVSPTILTNVTTDSTLFQDEIFGPVLPVIKYDSWDDVFDMVNSTEIPLALYLFSRSSKNIKRVLKSTTAGTSCINETTVQFIHPELPFGGHNFSGIGKAHGKYGFDEFSNERAILKQRVGWTSAKMIYPPYTRLKRKIIDFLTWRM